MAILKGIIAEGLSGKIGGVVFRRCKGKTVVAKAPAKRKRPLSERELEIRRLFLEGVRYAKNVMTDPELKSAYEKVALPGQTAYNLALRDAGHAPEVLDIEAAEYSGIPGQVIIVEAVDDFTVKSLTVFITSASNKLIESGEAVLLPDGIHWLYTVQKRNQKVNGCSIKAIAADLPGNEGSLEIFMIREN